MFSRNDARPTAPVSDLIAWGLVGRAPSGRLSDVRFGHLRAADETNAGDDGPEGAGGEETLEDAARREREYLRGRLGDELGREPTEEELSEWLRQHTEGY